MPIFSAIPNFPHSCLSALHVSVITPLLALAFFTYFTILGGLQAVPLYQSYQIRDPTRFRLFPISRFAEFTISGALTAPKCSILTIFAALPDIPLLPFYLFYRFSACRAFWLYRLPILRPFLLGATNLPFYQMYHFAPLSVFPVCHFNRFRGSIYSAFYLFATLPNLPL